MYKRQLQPCVSGKDVILHLIGEIGLDGALYQSLEFAGEGVSSLSMDDRFTISNMAIEAGAKNGIFAVDEVTRAYVDGRVNRPYTVYEADPDAVYEQVIDLDLGEICLLYTSRPFSVSGTNRGQGLENTSVSGDNR